MLPPDAQGIMIVIGIAVFSVIMTAFFGLVLATYQGVEDRLTYLEKVLAQTREELAGLRDRVGLPRTETPEKPRKPFHILPPKSGPEA